MKKRVNSELTWLFTPLFPKEFSKKYRGSIAVLGIGGNLGNVPRRFNKLALALASNPRVQLLRTSPILKNPPFGYVKQPDFYNALMVVATTLSPIQLLHFCLYTEKRFKRIRTFKNAPRTLDIDIIFYAEKELKKRDLTIPHPHWFQRDSVILPLQYLGIAR